jgi:hypothetical protein
VGIGVFSHGTLPNQEYRFRLHRLPRFGGSLQADLRTLAGRKMAAHVLALCLGQVKPSLDALDALFETV